MTAGGQMLLGPTGNIWFAKAPDHGELDALRTTFIIGLHGGHKGCLATGAASAFAATSLTTQIGVIHLHQTRQTLFLTTLEHHLHQFVLHPPRRIVGNAQLSMQLHCRDAFFGLGQKVDRLKPNRQWQFAGFKDGAGNDRRLSMTPIALAQFAGVEMTAFVMAAVGTDEAIRPTQFEQGIEAFLFFAIMFQEGIEAEAFLELDRISFHGIYSFLIK